MACILLWSSAVRSNLPFLSKLLEKVVLYQLRKHLLANNLCETFQSAYRAHDSKETALLDVRNCLHGSSDEGHVSILTSLNVSAAFGGPQHPAFRFAWHVWHIWQGF